MLETQLIWLQVVQNNWTTVWLDFATWASRLQHVQISKYFSLKLFMRYVEWDVNKTMTRPSQQPKLSMTMNSVTLCPKRGWDWWTGFSNRLLHLRIILGLMSTKTLEITFYRHRMQFQNYKSRVNPAWRWQRA